MDRRRFLKKSALAAGLTTTALLSSSHISCTQNQNPPPDKPKIPENIKVIVFQGDSITDGGRNRQQLDPNRRNTLGNGYVNLIVARLLGEHPEAALRCYNRGISGNKAYQLAERWQEDCLDLQPDVLSILIGVNDFWHSLTSGYEGTVKTYEQDLRALLDRTKAVFPDIKLILGEPFAVAGGTAINADWYPAFDAYRTAAYTVASDYQAQWIPYQTLFDEALGIAPVEYWCPDGVHPDPAGNHLMAEAWIEAFNNVLK